MKTLKFISNRKKWLWFSYFSIVLKAFLLRFWKNVELKPSICLFASDTYCQHAEQFRTFISRSARSAVAKVKGFNSRLFIVGSLYCSSLYAFKKIVCSAFFCQGVLQGKSRNVIVRELQRTGLDVNLAVNNLLSRDDEDNDDVDDGTYLCVVSLFLNILDEKLLILKTSPMLI